MPHVTIKLWPGRSEEVKKELAAKLAQEVAQGLGANIGSVSVAFEEISPDDWEEKVYKPEILNNKNIYFEPDYQY